MSQRTKRKVELARRAADFLASIGQKGMAADVRRLAIANASLSETCTRLYHDNMELRRKLALEPAPAPRDPDWDDEDFSLVEAE